MNTDASGNIYIINNTATLQVQVSQAPGLYPLTFQYETNKLSFTQTNILTRPALPDSLYVEASALYIDTTARLPAAITFTVIPKRVHGAVSTGFSLNAQAYQIDSYGGTVAENHFTGLANNVLTNGQIVIGFLPDPKEFILPPPVYVDFYCLNNQGSTVSKIYPLYYR